MTFSEKVDERGCVGAIARDTDALEIHGADRAQPQQNVHSGLTLEEDYVNGEKTLIVENRGRITRAKNSRGNNSVMT